MAPVANVRAAKRVVLLAPLSGPLLSIESVPDPVFAQKMVGDGVSIDPLDQYLLAPCDGEILQLHSAGHALTMVSEDGLEVMIHIGLDTVELNGQGFSPRVTAGDRVRCGDILIEFDIDFVATNARSLLTQVVITNSELVTRFEPATGGVRAGEDEILGLWLGEPGGMPEPESETAGEKASNRTRDFSFSVAPAPTAMPQQTRSREPAVDERLRLQSEEISVPNKSGLHARPAAVLANLAKKFKADIRLQCGDRSANAKSVVGIMELEVGYRDRVRLLASGDDAGEALTALTPLLAAGLGDEGLAAAPAPASVVVESTNNTRDRPLLPGDANLLPGLAASPGLAIGNIFQLRQEEIGFDEYGSDSHDERRRLDSALEESKVQLESLQARLREEADAGKAAIFAAHEELVDDPDLLQAVLDDVATGKSAAWAWNRAIQANADQLARAKNPVLAERANDLRDVGLRVLRLLTGTTTAEYQQMPAGSILVAEELTPSATASLDRDKVRGFCTLMGGTSSHVAILARSLDIPAVVGVPSRALDIETGTLAILDGDSGTLQINPSSEQMEATNCRITELTGNRAEYLKQSRDPAVTRDGITIEVAANIGSLADIRRAVQFGADGVGLLRTEFLFMDRARAPSEEEQLQAYRDIGVFLNPEQILVIRTLDVGGDKPLSYLTVPREENPFLGERGIRISLDRPEILRQQIRAILRAAAQNRVAILLPMVATIDEIRRARKIIEAEQTRLGSGPVPVGIMVEVPATALMARQFAREVDFFSIGTNDLTQYTLAMDRDHPRLAPAIDSLNPAVLRLIAATVAGGAGENCWVGVCGGIASDPQATPFLLGLGITRLSCSVPTIPAIKARVRSLDLANCRELAKKALEEDSPAAVRQLLAKV